MTKWILFANAAILCASGIGSLLAVLSKPLADMLRPLGYVGVAWAGFGVLRVGYHVFTGHSLRSSTALMAIVTVACLGPNAAMLISPKYGSKLLQLLTAAGCLALTVFAWSTARRFG